MDYFIPIYHDSGEMLQMVSLDQDKLVGYFGVRFNRETNAAYDLEIIKFGDSLEFSIDLRDFFVSLYDKFGVEKVIFSVIIGNPAERLYDNVIRTYGGRIVGTFKNDVKLYDGQLYDVKWYEIAKDDFDFDKFVRLTWREGFK